MQPIARRAVLRVDSSGVRSEEDDVAIEEPLEIRVDGDTAAITMRTPGDDAKLALGFLFAESVIDSADDVTSVAPCGKPGDEGYGNVIDVRSGPGKSLEVERVLDSRRFEVTSACGVCGRKSISDLLERCRPVESTVAVSRALVAQTIASLAERQPTFARTGGLHAAALFTSTGDLLAAAEDVGRHNAVDKVVGTLILGRALGRAGLLAVSGRASFEIIQKAARAQIPVVASVSAPSSLAVDLAQALKITLISFVRGDRMNVYSQTERFFP